MCIICLMPSMWKVGCWSDSLPLLWSLLIVTRYCLHLSRSSLTSQTTVLLVSLILFTGQQAKWELLRDDPQVISCHCYPVVFKIEEVDYGEKRAHQVTNNAGCQSRDGRFRYIHQDFPRDTYSSHSISCLLSQWEWLSNVHLAKNSTSKL